ncbi:protein limb expression 1-like [Corythoichthys intestinalis]|uniref:protein limb expression 1-like n=1 Tax=Corythoichthys intestinalis TaxID=161448 RepID=UPI0025A5FAA2|nr:protein limb expression 1-like [Corythoichthys intestinalis]XP_061804227.1 protein limb expression 1-like [Nerophis lumbriciformis]
MTTVENEDTIMSYLSQSDIDLSPKDFNVVAMLHDFWEQKQLGHMDGSSTGSNGSIRDKAVQMEMLLLYESAASTGPPFVCYVTLPGGSCFGNYKLCNTQAEARRDAARVALMNSLVNELPCRRICPQFISQSLHQATLDSDVSLEDAHDSSTHIGTYSLLLHSYMGRTMLEFQEMMTVFQLLHWNGTLKVLRERQCSRQSVITYYTKRGLDEYMRSSMALDWLDREQRSPGHLGEELQVAQRELLLARRRGIELRFYKEKTSILTLALSQAYIHHTPDFQSQAPDNREQLPLHMICTRDKEMPVTSSCSSSPSLHEHINPAACGNCGRLFPSDCVSTCSFCTIIYSEKQNVFQDT